MTAHKWQTGQVIGSGKQPWACVRCGCLATSEEARKDCTPAALARVSGT